MLETPLFPLRDDGPQLFLGGQESGHGGGAEAKFSHGGGGWLRDGVALAWRSSGDTLFVTEGSLEEELQHSSLRIVLPGGVLCNAAVAVFPYEKADPSSDQESAALCILTEDGTVHRIVLPVPVAAAPLATAGAGAVRRSCLTSAETRSGTPTRLSDFAGSLACRLDVPVNAACCRWVDRRSLVVASGAGIRLVRIAEGQQGQQRALDVGQLIVPEAGWSLKLWRSNADSTTVALTACQKQGEPSEVLCAALGADWVVRVFAAVARRTLCTLDLRAEPSIAPHLKLVDNEGALLCWHVGAGSFSAVLWRPRLGKGGGVAAEDASDYDAVAESRDMTAEFVGTLLLGQGGPQRSFVFRLSNLVGLGGGGAFEQHQPPLLSLEVELQPPTPPNPFTASSVVEAALDAAGTVWIMWDTHTGPPEGERSAVNSSQISSHLAGQAAGVAHRCRGFQLQHAVAAEDEALAAAAARVGGWQRVCWGGGGLDGWGVTEALDRLEGFYLRRLFAPGRFFSLERLVAAVNQVLPADMRRITVRDGVAGFGSNAADVALDVQGQVLSAVRQNGGDAIASLESAVGTLSTLGPENMNGRIARAAQSDAAAAIGAISDCWRGFLAVCRDIAEAKEEPPLGLISSADGSDADGVDSPLVVRQAGVCALLPEEDTGIASSSSISSSSSASSASCLKVLQRCASTAGAVLDIAAVDALLLAQAEACCGGLTFAAASLARWMDARLGEEARKAAESGVAAAKPAIDAAVAAARALGRKAQPQQQLDAFIDRLSPARLALSEESFGGGGGEDAMPLEDDDLCQQLTSRGMATAIALEAAERFRARYDAARDGVLLLRLVLAAPASSAVAGSAALAAIRGRALHRLTSLTAWYAAMVCLTSQTVSPGAAPLAETCFASLYLTGPSDAMAPLPSGNNGAAFAGLPILAGLLLSHREALALFLRKSTAGSGSARLSSTVGPQRGCGDAVAFLLALCEPGLKGFCDSGGGSSALEAWLRASGQWAALLLACGAAAVLAEAEVAVSSSGEWSGEAVAAAALRRGRLDAVAEAAAMEAALQGGAAAAASGVAAAARFFVEAAPSRSDALAFGNAVSVEILADPATAEISATWWKEAVAHVTAANFVAPPFAQRNEFQSVVNEALRALQAKDLDGTFGGAAVAAASLWAPLVCWTPVSNVLTVLWQRQLLPLQSHGGGGGGGGGDASQTARQLARVMVALAADIRLRMVLLSMQRVRHFMRALTVLQRAVAAVAAAASSFAGAGGGKPQAAAPPPIAYEAPLAMARQALAALPSPDPAEEPAVTGTAEAPAVAPASIAGPARRLLRREESVLWSCVFQIALEAREFNAAAQAMRRNPDEGRRKDNVAVLVVTMCESGCVGQLCAVLAASELDSTSSHGGGGWSAEAEAAAVLERRADATRLSLILEGGPEAVIFYDCAYVFHAGRGLWADAAALQLSLLRRLESAGPMTMLSLEAAAALASRAAHALRMSATTAANGAQAPFLVLPRSLPETGETPAAAAAASAGASSAPSGGAGSSSSDNATTSAPRLLTLRELEGQAAIWRCRLAIAASDALESRRPGAADIAAAAAGSASADEVLAMLLDRGRFDEAFEMLLAVWADRSAAAAGPLRAPAARKRAATAAAALAWVCAQLEAGGQAAENVPFVRASPSRSYPAAVPGCAGGDLRRHEAWALLQEVLWRWDGPASNFAMHQAAAAAILDAAPAAPLPRWLLESFCGRRREPPADTNLTWPWPMPWRTFASGSAHPAMLLRLYLQRSRLVEALDLTVWLLDTSGEASDSGAGSSEAFVPYNLLDALFARCKEALRSGHGDYGGLTSAFAKAEEQLRRYLLNAQSIAGLAREKFEADYPTRRLPELPAAIMDM